MFFGRLYFIRRRHIQILKTQEFNLNLQNFILISPVRIRLEYKIFVLDCELAKVLGSNLTQYFLNFKVKFI